MSLVGFLTHQAVVWALVPSLVVAGLVSLVGSIGSNWPCAAWRSLLLVAVLTCWPRVDASWLQLFFVLRCVAVLTARVQCVCLFWFRRRLVHFLKCC